MMCLTLIVLRGRLPGLGTKLRVSVTDKRGRYSIRCDRMVLE